MSHAITAPNATTATHRLSARSLLAAAVVLGTVAGLYATPPRHVRRRDHGSRPGTRPAAPRHGPAQTSARCRRRVVCGLAAALPCSATARSRLCRQPRCHGGRARPDLVDGACRARRRPAAHQPGHLAGPVLAGSRQPRHAPRPLAPSHPVASITRSSRHTPAYPATIPRPVRPVTAAAGTHGAKPALRYK